MSAAISYIYSRDKIIHKTNLDKVQTEITLIQTYEIIQTITHNIPPHKEFFFKFLQWSESFCKFILLSNPKFHNTGT